MYWLNSNAVVHYLKANASATSQPALSLGKVKEIPIPLPPLVEQQRIAAILAKADRLRRLRRYALEISDSYLQSVFLEMFGDPVVNDREWPRARIGEIGIVQTGNTPPREEVDNYGSYIEWVKSDDIDCACLTVRKSKEGLSEKGYRVGRHVKSGAILVTCIAGSARSIGNAAVTDRSVAFNQQINAITPNKDMDLLFLYGMLRVGQHFVQSSTTLGMKRIITKEKFENLMFIKPPLSLQEKYREVVQKHDRLREQQREAVRQAEHLFQTLLHRAFRGS